MLAELWCECWMNICSTKGFLYKSTMRSSKNKIIKYFWEFVMFGNFFKHSNMKLTTNQSELASVKHCQEHSLPSVVPVQAQVLQTLI